MPIRMRIVYAFLLGSLLLGGCIQHPPRDPEKVRRSEARKKRVDEKIRRQREGRSNRAAQVDAADSSASG
jgi:hypothetical protein